MRKYDKIYYERMDSPDRLVIGKWNEGEKTVVADAEVASLTNVIVCTIEELRDLYLEGWDEGKGQIMEVNDRIKMAREQAFKSFLKSKGVEI